MSKRSPLDFYHQHIWKLEKPGKKVESFYICTRCNTLQETYDDVRNHCDNQDCTRVDRHWFTDEKLEQRMQEKIQ